MNVKIIAALVQKKANRKSLDYKSYKFNEKRQWGKYGLNFLKGNRKELMSTNKNVNFVKYDIQEFENYLI